MLAITSVVAFLGLCQHGTAMPKASWGGHPKSNTYRFLSYNIRYDSMPDEISLQETINSWPAAINPQPDPYFFNATAEQPWSTRRIYVANGVLHNHADFFGGQEILKRQMDDLTELLGDEYAHVGIGRAGGDEDEFAPIFYKRSAAELLEWDTFWLSPTPFDISYYPNTTNYRIATVARFKSSGGVTFTMINTHLDHQNDEQRQYGMSLILHRAKYEAIKSKGGPVVLSGDFNSKTWEGGYRIVTGELPPVPNLNATFLEKYSWTAAEQQEAGVDDDFVMQDLLGQAPRHRRTGHWATFTNWNAPGNASSFNRIDYMMAGSNGGWTAKAYHVAETLFDDGVWASDHRPVFVDMAL